MSVTQCYWIWIGDCCWYDGWLRALPWRYRVWDSPESVLVLTAVSEHVPVRMASNPTDS